VLEAEHMFVIEVEVNPLTIGENGVGLALGAVNDPVILYDEHSHREEIGFCPGVLVRIVDVEVNRVPALGQGLDWEVTLTFGPPLRSVKTTESSRTGPVLNFNGLADVLAGARVDDAAVEYHVDLGSTGRIWMLEQGGVEGFEICGELSYLLGSSFS
jgi:hypothetical protein